MNPEEFMRDINSEKKVKERKMMLLKQRSECIKSVPNFWSLAFMGHRDLRYTFSGAVKYIISMEVAFDKLIFINFTDGFIEGNCVSKIIDEPVEDKQSTCAIFNEWLKSRNSIISLILIFDLWNNPVQYIVMPDLVVKDEEIENRDFLIV